MLFTQDIGIDLGTANTLVFVKGKGIVIREPSVVAVDQKSNPPRVVAVGSEAKEMIGRTPGSIIAVRPLKDGVIAEFEIGAVPVNGGIHTVRHVRRDKTVIGTLYDKQALANKEATEIVEGNAVIKKFEDFTEDAVKEVLMNLAAANEMKTGQIMWPVRIAISGLASTPGGATEIAYLIGKEECLFFYAQSMKKALFVQLFF